MKIPLSVAYKSRRGWHHISLKDENYNYDIETGFYYLQSRYYDPAIGRFISADEFASTGQGFLGFNMFTYCRNNPVCRTDASGTVDMNCLEEADDDFDVTPGEDDLGYCTGGGGVSTWDSFSTSMKSAAGGLKMAFGEKIGVEDHHFFSNKNKTYSPKFKDVADKYDLNLNKGWNVRALEGHRGRHTNAYHEFMLQMLYEIDKIAGGDPEAFLHGINILIDYVEINSWITYARN
jgi:RHS repeat-associated protein